MWNLRNIKCVLDFYNVNGVRYLSNKSSYITSIKRKMYLRTYPTSVVSPNGSVYTIRHFEPRRIIKLPLDITTLDPHLQKEILERRKPKKKIVIENEVEDNFDSNIYIKMLQKNKAGGR